MAPSSSLSSPSSQAVTATSTSMLWDSVPDWDTTQTVSWWSPAVRPVQSHDPCHTEGATSVMVLSAPPSTVNTTMLGGSGSKTSARTWLSVCPMDTG